MDVHSSKRPPNLDLSGFKVEATDGDIGKVDKATYEVGGSYIVVDTGPWIFGKKVMLPAGVIQDIDPDEKRSSSAAPRTRSRTRPSSTSSVIATRTTATVGGYYGRGDTHDTTTL